MRRIPLMMFALTGCIETVPDTNSYVVSGEELPDWTLQNVVTGEDVGPTDFEQNVSAYYFGHAT